SRAADQRGEQRVNKVQQMRGEGNATDAKSSAKRSLYVRLGAESGMREIIEDFVDRAIHDPRVNWDRKGIKAGGILGVGGRSVAWSPSPGNVAKLQEHLIQFLALATGGPSKYEGRDIKDVH